MIADLVVKTGEKVMFRNMKKGFSSRCEIILVPSNITYFLYHLHHLLLPCLPSLEHTGALCEAIIQGDIFVELESVQTFLFLVRYCKLSTVQRLQIIIQSEIYSSHTWLTWKHDMIHLSYNCNVVVFFHFQCA